jgi:hypothetical protein
VKEIIDTHIIEYEKYYKFICRNYYNGRYLSDDLFQELYLCFLDADPNEVKKFADAKKLHYLGALIIRNTFGKRGYHKRQERSETSPLFELSNITELVDKRIREDQTKEVNLEKLMDDLYKRDWFSHDVFMLAQNESINSLSKRTKIDRQLLTSTYKEARTYLLNRIDEF